MYLALRVPLFVALFVAVAPLGCAQTPPGSSGVGATMLDGADLFNYDRSLPLQPEYRRKPAGPKSPDGPPVTAAAGAEPVYTTQPDLKAYKLSYLSANGQRVPAFLILPTKPAGQKAPCIILQHGLGQDKRALAMIWSTFARDGYAILAIDAQYHGDRKPRLPGKMTLELFGLDIYSTRELIVQTVIDLRRGIDYLETRKEIDPKRIGYVGFSMGGILGTLLAAVDDRVQAPVLALAGGNWKLMAEQSQHASAIKARKERGANGIGWQPLEPFDPIHYAGRISPRPVLFINGDNDTTVPVACARELHGAAGPGKEVLFYKGGHVPNGIEFINVLGKIQQWLDKRLK